MSGKPLTAPVLTITHPTGSGLSIDTDIFLIFLLFLGDDFQPCSALYCLRYSQTQSRQEENSFKFTNERRNK
jgi:hypothetical protein